MRPFNSRCVNVINGLRLNKFPVIKHPPPAAAGFNYLFLLLCLHYFLDGLFTVVCSTITKYLLILANFPSQQSESAPFPSLLGQHSTFFFFSLKTYPCIVRGTQLSLVMSIFKNETKLNGNVCESHCVTPHCCLQPVGGADDATGSTST